MKVSTPAAYRLDIQGLRAVAALLVAAYHIWLGRVSGGVDVFFVVTAYLITHMLLRQLESSGRIDFRKFWGGLARRLLPMALLVSLAVTVASIFWLPRTLWNETIQQAIASTVYLENWQLAFDAVDYLAQGRAASPFQHYWALSLQGQFYLLWPFVFVAAAALASALHMRARSALLWVFGGIFVMSLTFSIIATRHHQAFTYFNTFARLWEFCIGALLAVAPRFELGRKVRVTLGWLGLAGILACGMIFHVSRVFPGYAALWPGGCAALILLTGPSGSRAGVDRLLSSKLLTYLGGISYGIYLWHWPVLVFYRWFAAHKNMTLTEGLTILGASIALAYLSTHALARLAGRQESRETPLRLKTLLVAGMLPVLSIAIGWGGYYLQQKKHDARPIAIQDRNYPGALAREKGFIYQGGKDVPLYPGMLAVQDDLPQIYEDGCYRPDPHWQRDHCIYGERGAGRTLAVVGGSHSVHWLPALDMLAREHRWRIVVYSKSNCLFSEEVAHISLDRWCERWNGRIMDILRKDRPEVVFTTATRGIGPKEHVPEGFLQRWGQLHELGIHVVAIRDTPWMKFWVPECLEMRGHDSTDCGKATHQVLANVNPVNLMQHRPANVGFIEMTDYFCDVQYCPPVIGNIIVYRDDSHITASYARTLAPMLGRELAAVLPQGWMVNTAPSYNAKAL